MLIVRSESTIKITTTSVPRTSEKPKAKAEKSKVEKAAVGIVAVAEQNKIVDVVENWLLSSPYSTITVEFFKLIHLV